MRLFECAAGEKSSEMLFDLMSEEQTGWGGLTTQPSGRTIRVQVCRLDEVVPRDRVIQVLKIDTEGADAWVLDGAQSLLRCKQIEHVFFEQNLPRMKSLGLPPDAPFRILELCGYKIEAIGGDDVTFYARPN